MKPLCLANCGLEVAVHFRSATKRASEGLQLWPTQAFASLKPPNCSQSIVQPTESIVSQSVQCTVRTIVLRSFNCVVSTVKTKYCQMRLIHNHKCEGIKFTSSHLRRANKTTDVEPNTANFDALIQIAQNSSS